MATPPRYLPALITPFTRSGDLDLEAHAHNVEVLGGLGVKGFVIGGSNGEGPYLEAGERKALVETARETLGRRAHLMCGVMAETQRLAERQLGEAAEAGADSVLVLTPTTLARGKTDLVLRYFQEVAGMSPLPVFLYTVPALTAYSLPEAAAIELSGVDNVAGMKDSSGDPIRIQRIAADAADGFLVFNGASRSIALAMAAGAHGAITGSGNYAPSLVLELIDAARRSATKAMPLQHRLTELSSKIESGGVPAVKAASVGIGLSPGSPRAPLRAMPARRSSDLARLVSSS